MQTAVLHKSKNLKTDNYYFAGSHSNSSITPSLLYRPLFQAEMVWSVSMQGTQPCHQQRFQFINTGALPAPLKSAAESAAAAGLAAPTPYTCWTNHITASYSGSLTIRSLLYHHLFQAEMVQPGGLRQSTKTYNPITNGGSTSSIPAFLLYLQIVIHSCCNLPCGPHSGLSPTHTLLYHYLHQNNIALRTYKKRCRIRLCWQFSSICRQLAEQVSPILSSCKWLTCQP